MLLISRAQEKATTVEINEPVLACENAGALAEVLAGSLLELAALLDRVAEDS